MQKRDCCVACLSQVVFHITTGWPQSCMFSCSTHDHCNLKYSWGIMWLGRYICGQWCLRWGNLILSTDAGPEYYTILHNVVFHMFQHSLIQVVVQRSAYLFPQLAGGAAAQPCHCRRPRCLLCWARLCRVIRMTPFAFICSDPLRDTLEIPKGSWPGTVPSRRQKQKHPPPMLSPGLFLTEV